MKRGLNLILAVFLLSCSNSGKSQTWTVGNTTLTESDLVTGITLPWEILWGPDDYIWCTTRPGLVLRINPATGNFTTVFSITSIVPSSGGGEPGLLGMAMHPDWANTPKVYLVYNYKVGFTVYERLVVCDWDGTNLINETTLIDEIHGGNIHNGSRLMITPDNKILMSTGDIDNSGYYSQIFEDTNGKILRINLDGSIPADNPDPTAYTYSWGHRNPQGLCLGPNGIIYSSEHGANSSDEFNIIEAGRNYGWPNVQGACNTGAEQTFCDANDVKEPLKEWTPCIAVNGLEYYTHPAIPEWQGCVLMAVLGGLGGNYERMTVLHLSDDGLSVTSEESFFSSFNLRIRDLCVNPYNGTLYVAFNGSTYPGAGPNKIKEFTNLDFVSVQEANKEVVQDMKLYPNPAETITFIEVTESLVGEKLQVYGADGVLVKEIKITSNSFSLDISDLTMGNYFVSASSSLGTITRAFRKD